MGDIGRWYERYFGLDYLRIYRLADTAAQLAFLQATLADGLGGRLLDLPCGHGRHAVELARWGWRVTGVDLSWPFLSTARQAAGANGLSLPLVRADMRAVPLADASFDVAICMFTSLGYFETVAENQRVLAEFARLVRAGGRLLLDLANIDYVRRQPGTSRWEKEGASVASRYHWDESTRRAVTRRHVIFSDGRVEDYQSSVRLFEGDEIGAMLTATGWEVEMVYGSYDRAPLGLEQPRRILLCRRSA
ncbi:MAG: class I SAM-dependent methyltransferase [Armatimonadetes bacterium]|nr:class I SAM-dependent methyltransferase [Armatimonadota bacterium]